MAAYLEEFLGAVRARVGAVWPETATNGIWEDVEIMRVPLADTLLPMAVLECEAQRGDWGLDNLAYEVTLNVWRVQRSDRAGYVGSGKPGRDMRAQLEALRDEFYTTELGAGQVLEVERLAWNSRLPPNLYFITTEQKAAVGLLQARCLVGATAA